MPKIDVAAVRIYIDDKQCLPIDGIPTELQLADQLTKKDSPSDKLTDTIVNRTLCSTLEFLESHCREKSKYRVD